VLLRVAARALHALSCNRQQLGQVTQWRAVCASKQQLTRLEARQQQCCHTTNRSGSLLLLLMGLEVWWARWRLNCRLLRDIPILLLLL
jgi:hypothetical protein